MSNIQNNIFKSILSSPLILKEYSNGKVLTPEELRSLCFLDVRQNFNFKPDYTYKNEWDYIFLKGTHFFQIISKSIFTLSSIFLRNDGDSFVVPLDLFDDWQSTILQISPLLLTVAAIQQDCESKAHGDPNSIILQKLLYSALPEIDSRSFKNLLSQKGLSEVHMHLNGTTEANKVWLDALKMPEKFYIAFKNALKKDTERKLTEQLYEIFHEKKDPKYILTLLSVARFLRKKITDIIWRPNKTNNILSYKWFHATFRKSNLGQIKNSTYTTEHPIVYYLPLIKKYTPLAKEAIFLNHALSHLKTGGHIFATLLHYYTLCQSCFSKLLIQQTTQTGFEQFQRIADNKLRDPSEGDYQYRFHQIIEHLPQTSNHLEGRFAPKASIYENKQLLTAINTGWNNFKKNSRLSEWPELSLTAHFIKSPDKKSTKYRYHRLRNELKYRGLYLAHMKKIPQIAQLLTSIDAAANELDTPPEVFAPVYRLMKAKGCKKFTYHVGEDFLHIISGLRSIWEAINFLDLQSGDRIGHGTALGISPNLWKKQLGNSVTLKREEWLDDLVFLYFFLIENEQTRNNAALYREQILNLAHCIYGIDFSDITLLKEAWYFRKLDPTIALNPSFGETTPVSSWRTREEALIRQFKSSYSFESFKLFELYHIDKEVRKRGKELIRVKLEDIPTKTIIQIQTLIIQNMNKKQIAMEVMPSSNVRISIYNNYKEHHIFRLLGLADDSPQACPTMCVASDDPGIFASCLPNEYAHIFKGLLDLGLKESEALSKLAWLIDNSWAYRFKNDILTPPTPLSSSLPSPHFPTP